MVDGLAREHKALGDLGIAQALGDELQHVELAPVRTASRSPVSSAARTRVPLRSRCRSTPEMAHVSVIDVDVTCGPDRRYG